MATASSPVRRGSLERRSSFILTSCAQSTWAKPAGRSSNPGAELEQLLRDILYDSTLGYFCALRLTLPISPTRSLGMKGSV